MTEFIRSTQIFTIRSAGQTFTITHEENVWRCDCDNQSAQVCEHIAVTRAQEFMKAGRLASLKKQLAERAQRKKETALQPPPKPEVKPKRKIKLEE